MARHGFHRGMTGALLFGGLLGAGVALMSAPRSGRESRRKIGDFAEDMKEKAECYADLTKAKVTSAVERGREFLQEKKSILTAAIEAGREAYREETRRRIEGAHACENLHGGL